jgi:hypothetical protein
MAAAFIVSFALFASPRYCAAMSDEEMAASLADKLGGEFSPEALFVTVDGSHAYAEARGVVLSGVRIDTLRLEAILADTKLPEDDEIESLASLIAYSWGEVVMLERDINSYFKSHETRGFTGLVAKFAPTGFRAEGLYTAKFLFTLRMRLRATGNFALKPDGVYIEDASIFVEGLRQPGFLVEEIMERVNPLIEWDEIPFKITFKTIYMDGTSATMTGEPRVFDSGATAVWEKEGIAK